jgi:2-oxoglutarate dehydrogenase E2 component (dihydrolipoamide succinyltransferase)
MIAELKIPSPGESISEVEIASWFVENGEKVEKDQELGEIESDKATLPLIAPESGAIEILNEAGETVEVGQTVCKIDTEKAGKEKPKSKEDKSTEKSSEKDQVKDAVASDKKSKESEEQETHSHQKQEKTSEDKEEDKETTLLKISPAAKKMMQDLEMDAEDLLRGLKRISKKEVEGIHSYLKNNKGEQKEHSAKQQAGAATREIQKNNMTSLRRKVSQRLVAVKNETAMLTTFNEADMTEIMNLRKKWQKKFMDKHGLKLGFMSFFTKAVTHALLSYPKVNSQIAEEEILSFQYVDVGIAVQTDKGLMVPVLRNTESMSIPEIEIKIAELAQRARKGRLSLDEMEGGTFSITNGGVFGSLLSTPILNPPQSAILGMHNIVERPVALNGQVVIRPMMYLALSYDHRIIDGKDSVTFLKTVKELVENPLKLLHNDANPEAYLFDL